MREWHGETDREIVCVCARACVHEYLRTYTRVHLFSSVCLSVCLSASPRSVAVSILTAIDPEQNYLSS